MNVERPKRIIVRTGLALWVIGITGLVFWSWWDQQRSLPDSDLFDSFRWTVGEWGVQIAVSALVALIVLGAAYGIVWIGRDVVRWARGRIKECRTARDWLELVGPFIFIPAFLVAAYYWFLLAVYLAEQTTDWAFSGDGMGTGLAAVVLALAFFFGIPAGLVSSVVMIWEWVDNRRERLSKRSSEAAE